MHTLHKAVSVVALLFASATLSGSEPIVAGGLALEGPQMGNCILVNNESASTLQGRVINVFGRDFKADDFTFRGQMRAQTDPRTIEALLRRYNRLVSEDPEGLLVKIGNTVDNMFQDIDVSGSDLSLGEKLSVMIAMSETDVAQREDMIFLAKRYPSVAAVVGSGFIEQTDTLVTYELRLCPLGKEGPDDGDQVIGRVTVDPKTPYIAPAPGRPHAVRVRDDRGSLNVRLRWATPDGYASAGPLVFGYNLYRIPESMGDSDWIANPPSRDELEDKLDIARGSLDTSVYCANHTPILPPHSFTETEAAGATLKTLMAKRYAHPADWYKLSYNDIDDSHENTPELYTAPETRVRRIDLEKQIKPLQADFIYSDDNNRWFGGVPFQKGEGFYYAVVARNALGTGGELSPFTLIRIPDESAPKAPENLRVENSYNYDDSVGDGAQQLVLKWDALRDENGAIREDVYYFVYRWNTSTEMLEYTRRPFATGIETDIQDANTYFDGHPPVLSGLIAGPGDLQSPNEKGVFTFSDPTISSDYKGITFFYTVRAVTSNGEVFPGSPVFSPHTAPVWGVLRDREGPGLATNLTLTVYSMRASVEANGHSMRAVADDENLNIPRGRFLLQMTCTPNSSDSNLDKSLKRAFFRYNTDGTGGLNGDGVMIETIDFTDGEPVTLSLMVDQGLSDLSVGCMVLLKNGQSSDWSYQHIGKLSTSEPIVDVDFMAFVSDREEVWDIGEPYYAEGPDGEFEPPILSWNTGEDTWGYHIYRRVDDGHAELLETVELPDYSTASMDMFEDFTYEDKDIPPSATRICYYYQPFDRHGNPGVRQRFDCMTVAKARFDLPVPTIANVEAKLDANDKPYFEVSWFCSPEGLERFGILVGDVDSGLGARTLSSEVVSIPEGVLAGWSGDFLHDEQLYCRYATLRPASFVAGSEATPETPAVVESGLFKTVITEGIEPGRQYRFRVEALGPAYYIEHNEVINGFVNDSSDPSEPLDAIWTTPREGGSGGQNGPDVQWPERAVSDAIDPESELVKPEFLNGVSNYNGENFTGVGILIGQIMVKDTRITFEVTPGGGSGGPEDPGGDLSGGEPGELGDPTYGDTSGGAYVNKAVVSIGIPFELEEGQSDDYWGNTVFNADTRFHYEFSSTELGNLSSESILPCLIYRMEVEPGTENASNNQKMQPVSGDLIQCCPVVSAENIAFDPIIDDRNTRVFRDPFLFIGEHEFVQNGDYFYPLYIRDTQPVIRGSTYRYFLVGLTDTGNVKFTWDIGTVTIPE